MLRIGVLIRCASQSFRCFASAKVTVEGPTQHSRHLPAAWLERLTPLCCSPHLFRQPGHGSVLLKHAAGLMSLHILPEGCVRGTMQDINWSSPWGSHSCRTSNYIEASFPRFFALHLLPFPEPGDGFRLFYLFHQRCTGSESGGVPAAFFDHDEYRSTRTRSCGAGGLSATQSDPCSAKST